MTNILSEKQNTQGVFNYLNEKIANISDNLFSTLGYEAAGNLVFNKAYFSSSEKISYDSLQKLSDQAQEKIDQLTTLAEEIQNLPLLNQVQKDLFLKRIEKSRLEMCYHQHAMYLEAEKAGFHLTTSEKTFHNQEKMKIEKLLYGPSILERPERLAKVWEKLSELFEEKKSQLSTEEQEFFQNKVLSFFENKPHKEKIEKPEEKEVFISEHTILPLVETMLTLQGIPAENILKIQISSDPQLQEPYQENEVFIVPSHRKDQEMYDYFKEQWLDKKFKVIKQVKGTNSVWINLERNHIKLWAPKDWKYNLKNSVLPVIFDHEIATHVKTWLGNLANSNIRDSERGDLEEGVAILNERIGKGDDLESIYETSIGDIGQFLGETLDDEQLKKALHIYFTLSGNTSSLEDRFLRIRRGVALGEKGSRRKDLTYGNSKEILKEMENLTQSPEGIEILNQYARAIYSTKLGFESLPELEQILEGIQKIEDLEPHFPIFAGKILYRKLFKGKLDKDEMLKSDIRSIISTNQEITYSQKKLLVQLKQLIEQDGEYQRSKDRLI